MKATFALSSAVEKVIIVIAFLPIVSMVYPETVSAAFVAQNQGNQALVFPVNSKQKSNEQSKIETIEEVNPTLTNPCYPAPIDSCNPDASPAHHSNVRAQSIAPVNTSSDYTGKHYSKEEVEALIVAYSAQYGIDPQTPKCIAFRESGYNQFSKNKRSSASGVFQYLTSTWRATDEGKAGMSVFDAEANVKAAVKYMAVHKSTKPWTVRGHCPALTFVK